MNDNVTSSGVGIAAPFGDMLRKDRQNRAPDVLNTIANLSSDEIFTPPEFANKMLDALADAWALEHGGASIWANPDVRFLDPATKSGVFLREIVKRLVEGQGNPPDGSGERRALVEQILIRQVFGIGITTLTALLSRRSIYCSKDATGEHSVAQSFTRSWGNIWFERTEHTWVDRKSLRQSDHIRKGKSDNEIKGTGRCRYCNAPESEYARGAGAETYAYAFLHTDNPKGLVAELYGANMHFDVIVGNPPYQMGAAPGSSGEDGERTGRLRDVPMYHRFVEQAKKMEPRFLAMVTPSRWMAGGLGLKEFRAGMLTDRHLRELVDFPQASEVFPGVEIKGGVSYFLWDSAYDGDTKVTVVRGDEKKSTLRRLDEFDVLVRDPSAVEILHKIQGLGEESITSILSADKEFGWTSNFSGFSALKRSGDVPIYYNRQGKRLVGYISRGEVVKSAQLIDTWKTMVPSAGSGGAALPDIVLGRPFIAPSPSVCTQTYLFFAVSSESEAKSVESYLTTKFLRFLVTLRKMTQHASPATYTWVPMQTWDRIWTDAELYKKYGLSDDEIAQIEAVVKPMDLSSSNDEN